MYLTENIVINLAGRVRRERVGKRDFVVAPLTMIVPGVLNGSHGPILYPAEEVAASAADWEGVILTDGHPPDWADVEYQDEYGMGYVHNPTIKNGKLKAEGWFDVDRTRRVNPKVLNAILNGHTIELSTGLRMDFDSTAGLYDGCYYGQIGRSFRPDHLAILIHDRGACSVAHGCGVNNDNTNPSLGATKMFSRQPAGGQLGLPEINWSTGRVTNSQATIERASAVFNSAGARPCGGPLGPPPIPIWNRQPESAKPCGCQVHNGHEPDGPAGGQLRHPEIHW